MFDQAAFEVTKLWITQDLASMATMTLAGTFSMQCAFIWHEISIFSCGVISKEN